MVFVSSMQASYAAFVRECVSKRRKILATRGFLENEDVSSIILTYDR